MKFCFAKLSLAHKLLEVAFQPCLGKQRIDYKSLPSPKVIWCHTAGISRYSRYFRQMRSGNIFLSVLWFRVPFSIRDLLHQSLGKVKGWCQLLCGKWEVICLSQHDFHTILIAHFLFIVQYLSGNSQSVGDCIHAMNQNKTIIFFYFSNGVHILLRMI